MGSCGRESSRLRADCLHQQLGYGPVFWLAISSPLHPRRWFSYPGLLLSRSVLRAQEIRGLRAVRVHTCVSLTQFGLVHKSCVCDFDSGGFVVEKALHDIIGVGLPPVSWSARGVGYSAQRVAVCVVVVGLHASWGRPCICCERLHAFTCCDLGQPELPAVTAIPVTKQGSSWGTNWEGLETLHVVSRAEELAEPMPLQRIVRPAPVMLLNSRPRTFVLFVGEKPYFPYISELVEMRWKLRSHLRANIYETCRRWCGVAQPLLGEKRKPARQVQRKVGSWASCCQVSGWFLATGARYKKLESIFSEVLWEAGGRQGNFVCMGLGFAGLGLMDYQNEMWESGEWWCCRSCGGRGSLLGWRRGRRESRGVCRARWWRRWMCCSRF